MPREAKSKSSSKSSSNYGGLDSRSNSSSSNKIKKLPKKGKSVSKRSKFLTSSRNSRSASRKSRSIKKYSSSRSVSEDKQVPLLRKRVGDMRSKISKIPVFKVGNIEMPEGSDFMQSIDASQSVNKEFKKLQARDSFLTSAVNAYESPNIIVKTISDFLIAHGNDIFDKVKDNDTKQRNFPKTTAWKIANFHRTRDGRLKDVAWTPIKYKWIGRGSYGRVFEIQYGDNKSDDNYLTAIKIVKLADESDLDELRRETNILDKMSKHPNYLKYKQHMVQGEHLYIFMECFKGQTLQRAISSFYDNLRFIQLFKEICDSICVLHNEKIVHQDLNPGNILVDVVTGEHRIYDFGMSLCFSDKKEQLCLGMNEKVTWPFGRGHSVYSQMAPWRTKDCGPADGCSYHDLKMGDYWAIIHYFFDEFVENSEFVARFHPYKKGNDSVLFTKDFPQLYFAFTGGDDFPSHLLKDITP